jgi:hypothetical protein
MDALPPEQPRFFETKEDKFRKEVVDGIKDHNKSRKGGKRGKKSNKNKKTRKVRKR